MSIDLEKEIRFHGFSLATFAELFRKQIFMALYCRRGLLLFYLKTRFKFSFSFHVKILSFMIVSSKVILVLHPCKVLLIMKNFT